MMYLPGLILQRLQDAISLKTSFVYIYLTFFLLKYVEITTKENMSAGNLSYPKPVQPQLVMTQF